MDECTYIILYVSVNFLCACMYMVKIQFCILKFQALFIVQAKFGKTCSVQYTLLLTKTCAVETSYMIIH